MRMPKSIRALAASAAIFSLVASCAPGGPPTGEPQTVAQRGPVGEEIEDLDRRGGDDRREGVREQVGAGTLSQPADDLPPPGGEAAGRAAQGLAESACDDVDDIADVCLYGVYIVDTLTYESLLSQCGAKNKRKEN